MVLSGPGMWGGGMNVWDAGRVACAGYRSVTAVSAGEVVTYSRGFLVRSFNLLFENDMLFEKHAILYKK